MTDSASTVLPRLRGRVVTGAGRGHGLRYPTANLDVDPLAAWPPDGVYLGWFELEAGASREGALGAGAPHPALVSVGTNPTFGDPGRTVEAYLYDFDDDLYGLSALLVFDTLLRPSERFDSAAELIAAMDRDADAGRRILAERGGSST